MTAGPALGHGTVDSSAPYPGQEVFGVVDRIELVFSIPVDSPEVALTGPNGRQIAGVIEVLDGGTVRFRMDPLTTEGEYVVGYSAIAPDGDAIKSAFAFTYTGPESLGWSWVVWLGLPAVLMVAMGRFAWWRLHERQASEPS